MVNMHDARKDNDSEDTQPAEEMNEDLCKWKIKTGKAMFALKTMIEEDMLEHICYYAKRSMEHPCLSLLKEE